MVGLAAAIHVPYCVILDSTDEPLKLIFVNKQQTYLPDTSSAPEACSLVHSYQQQQGAKALIHN